MALYGLEVWNFLLFSLFSLKAHYMLLLSDTCMLSLILTQVNKIFPAERKIQADDMQNMCARLPENPPLANHSALYGIDLCARAGQNGRQPRPEIKLHIWQAV